MKKISMMNTDKKNYPLISVVIPAYNAEKYLSSALESLEKQTYPQIEAVVVDDGSQDKTLELAKSFASQKIKTKVIHQENSGVSVARNTGMQHATGEFLMFLDADDMLPIYSIETLYHLLQEQNASVAIGALQESETFEETPAEPSQEKITMWKGTEALIASMSDHPACYSACGKLFKKSILYGISFPVGKAFHEDNYFCFQCFLKEPVVVKTDSVVYYYRINRKSSSYASFSDKHLDILSIADTKWDLIQDKDPVLLKYASNMILKSRLCFLMNLAHSKTHQYDSYIPKCVDEVRNRKKDFIPVGFRNRVECFIITSGLYPLYKKWMSSRNR